MLLLKWAHRVSCFSLRQQWSQGTTFKGKLPSLTQRSSLEDDTNYTSNNNDDDDDEKGENFTTHILPHPEIELAENGEKSEKEQKNNEIILNTIANTKHNI